MIGSPALDIDGVLAEAAVEPLMRGGNLGSRNYKLEVRTKFSTSKFSLRRSMHPWHDCYLDERSVETLVSRHHRGSEGHQEQVRARQGDRPPAARPRALTAPSTTRRTTASSRGPSATTATRSTRWCWGRSRCYPLTIVEARAIGVMRMRDEKGIDDKIIAVSVQGPRVHRLHRSPAAAAAPAARDHALLRGLQGARAQAGGGRGLPRSRRRAQVHPRSNRPVPAAAARRVEIEVAGLPSLP